MEFAKIRQEIWQSKVFQEIRGLYMPGSCFSPLPEYLESWIRHGQKGDL